VQLSHRDRLELRLGVAARIKFLAAIAVGSHPFPSRTRQLSPPAPMVVGPQGPSRVGRRQNIRHEQPADRQRSRGLFAFEGPSVQQAGAEYHVALESWRVPGREGTLAREATTACRRIT
jgi:hypothetical protein